MANTQEYNIILASLTAEEKQDVTDLRADFNDAYESLATQLTAVIGTYVAKVKDLCEQLEDIGLDEDEIRIIVKQWTPTRKDGEKNKPGTLSRQHIQRVLNAHFPQPTDDEKGLAKDLAGTLTDANADSFEFLAGVEKKAKKEETDETDETADDETADNSDDDESTDADGHTVESLTGIFRVTSPTIIAQALIASGVSGDVLAALRPQEAATVTEARERVAEHMQTIELAV